MTLADEVPHLAGQCICRGPAAAAIRSNRDRIAAPALDQLQPLVLPQPSQT
jgi:hypothetical protein